MSVKLTERAKELIPKSRIVSFATWKNKHSDEAIQIFQQADDEGRYLTDEDLEKIKAISPEKSSSLERAKLLRDKATEIVDKARAKVLEVYPNITAPGGELYPSERAEACWRDFWHFLRCITYGIAGNSSEFTSAEGLKNMELLYQELQVPLPAMIKGLESLKSYSLEEFKAEEKEAIAPYFDRLIAALKSFQKS
ncbi:MAG: phycobilisome protein [Cyanobacteriota bacterium]|nr:phycobilisome protein [Cyanobacteriota bacterium]